MSRLLPLLSSRSQTVQLLMSAAAQAGISILKDGKVIYTDDEATGGSHMTMTVAGHYKIPYEEAEVLKTTPEKEDEIFPVVKATIEKMATITEKFLNGYQVPAVLCCRWLRKL